MTDPLDSTLQNTGLDPSPAFEASLESLLGRAYDGEIVGPTTPVSPAPRPEGRRRAMVIGAAAALVVAAVAGVVIASNGSDPKTLDEATTTSEATVTPTAAPTSTVAPETTVATTVATSATPTSTLAPTTTVAPTIPPAVPQTVTIDLTQPATNLDPPLLVSLPTSAPAGDLYPTAIAKVAPGNRIAVLDMVTGELRFLDATTGAEVMSVPTDVPTIGSTDVAFDFWIGPDDVLYVNEQQAPVGVPAIVVYAPTQGRYTKVAQVVHGIGDAPVGARNAGIGLMYEGAIDPITPYLGIDGQPSGKTLGIDDISIGTAPTAGPDTCSFVRGDHEWTVTVIEPSDVPSRESSLCNDGIAEDAPGGSIVIDVTRPKPDGDIGRRISLLGTDGSRTDYDTDWTYIGATDDALFFSKLDQDSIDIGSVKI